MTLRPKLARFSIVLFAVLFAAGCGGGGGSPATPSTTRSTASSEGVITTVVGTGTSGYSGDGGGATAAQLTNPQGIAVDSSGNIIVADCNGYSIRVVAKSAGTFYGLSMTAGNIYTVAGTGVNGYSVDGTLATAAKISSPWGVAVDHDGNLLIAVLGSHSIRVVPNGNGTFYGVAMTAGYIYTVAGTRTQGYSGDGGPATGAQLNTPTGIRIDGASNLLIADFGNSRIRVVPKYNGTFYGVAMSAGNIYTVAGSATQGYAGDGGLATAAQLYRPGEVAVDGNSNLLIADTWNHRIRVVPNGNGNFYGIAMVAGNIYTVAGTGTGGYSGDAGSAATAELNYPYGIDVDASGNLFIADLGNSRIRVVAPTAVRYFGVDMAAGNIYTVAGTGVNGYSGDGGSATTAQLNGPYASVVDSGTGNLLIADNYNHRIRSVSP